MKKSEEEMKESITTFEQLLDCLNPLGKWQIWIYVCVSFVQFFYGAVNGAVVFFEITPPYVCEPTNLNPVWTTLQTQSIIR